MAFMFAGTCSVGLRWSAYFETRLLRIPVASQRPIESAYFFGTVSCVTPAQEVEVNALIGLRHGLQEQLAVARSAVGRR